MIAALCFAGGATAAAWGAAHLAPTRKVVAGFGTLSDDNRRIITMEWIAEGAFLIFIGAVVIAVTAIDRRADAASATYVTAAIGLMALAIVSLFTGFRIRHPPFRLCPLIFTISAALILGGTFT
ncbi:MAG TPA: hypothetical protein VFA83_16320 [Acidimicrobiales bacterium]|nr:hypothetical protein [Acidimicrobiales bacterium]